MHYKMEYKLLVNRGNAEGNALRLVHSQAMHRMIELSGQHT